MGDTTCICKGGNRHIIGVSFPLIVGADLGFWLRGFTITDGNTQKCLSFVNCFLNALYENIG